MQVYAKVRNTPHAVFRDVGLLASALGRADTQLYGAELYPDIHHKVAAVVDSINRNHPLLDGNKRLSLVVMNVIYLGNGYRYLGGDDNVELFVWIAGDHPDVREVAQRLGELWAAPAS